MPRIAASGQKRLFAILNFEQKETRRSGFLNTDDPSSQPI